MIGILLELLHEVRNEDKKGAIGTATGKNQLPEGKDLGKKIKEVWQSRK